MKPDPTHGIDATGNNREALRRTRTPHQLDPVATRCNNVPSRRSGSVGVKSSSGPGRLRSSRNNDYRGSEDEWSRFPRVRAVAQTPHPWERDGPRPRGMTHGPASGTRRGDQRRNRRTHTRAHPKGKRRRAIARFPPETGTRSSGSSKPPGPFRCASAPADVPSSSDGAGLHRNRPQRHAPGGVTWRAHAIAGKRALLFPRPTRTAMAGTFTSHHQPSPASTSAVPPPPTRARDAPASPPGTGPTPPHAPPAPAA
jgi:hypothetical protein